MYLLSPATYLRDLYGISIAFVIHSLDRSLSTRLIPAGARGHTGVLAFLHAFKISIAFPIRSLDHLLSARLILTGAF